MWPRRPWVQVPSLTQNISGCSVVRLARLLWEQEVGSSNLSTPTRRQYHLSLIKPSVKRGLSFCHIYSYLIKYIPKSDTPITDTLKTQSKNSTKRDPPSPWEAPPRLIYMLLLHKTGENVSGDIINDVTHIAGSVSYTHLTLPPTPYV